MGLACITISGKLGKDAVLKDAGNSQVLEFSVAVNHKIKGDEAVNWYRCSIWGKRGEALEQYLTSGQSVVVSGNLIAREFESNAGGTKTSLEINVNEVALVGGKPKARDDDDDEDEAPVRKPSKPAAKASTSKKSRADDDDDYWS